MFLLYGAAMAVRKRNPSISDVVDVISMKGIKFEELHLHLGGDPNSDEILARLTAMEKQMTDIQAALDAQTEAINANTAAMNEAITKVNEDVAHLQDLLNQQQALVDEALANDAQDAATIADLKAQNEALQTDVNATVERINANTALIAESTATLSSIDPVTGQPS